MIRSPAMSVVRQTARIAHRIATRLTPEVLEPGSGAAFDAFLRSQARLAGFEWYRRHLFRDELALLDRFLEMRGVTDQRAIEGAHRQRTMASLIRRVRRYYATLPPARQRVWLPLAPDVEATMRGGALLVGAHFGGALLTAVALSQLGIPLLMIVRTRPGATLRPTCVEICDLRHTSTQHAIGAAWTMLRRGGVVFMAADTPSERAGNNIVVNVLGRARRMSRGCAELALASKVPARPIFSRVEESGAIVTWTEPPLPTAGGSHEARVAALVQTYAERLSAVLARYPGNVTPGVMRLVVDGPAFEPGGR